MIAVLRVQVDGWEGPFIGSSREREPEALVQLYGLYIIGQLEIDSSSRTTICV